MTYCLYIRVGLLVSYIVVPFVLIRLDSRLVFWLCSV